MESHFVEYDVYKYTLSDKTTLKLYAIGDKLSRWVYEDNKKTNTKTGSGTMDPHGSGYMLTRIPDEAEFGLLVGFHDDNSETLFLEVPFNPSKGTIHEILTSPKRYPLSIPRPPGFYHKEWEA